MAAPQETPRAEAALTREHYAEIHAALRIVRAR